MPFDERCLIVDLTPGFYEAMNLRAARERDNRTALAKAAARVVDADAAYRAIVICQAEDRHVLRAVKRAERPGAPRLSP